MLIKNRIQQNNEEWYCCKCKKVLALNLFYKNTSKKTGICSWCKSCMAKYCKSKKDKLRNAVLEYFGGICIKCGFSDKRALQLDHINGGGNIQRKTGEGGHTYYTNILLGKYDGKLQVLCANCNWIKKVENKECNKIIWI